MKVNKKQRIIVILATVLFVVIGLNYYYSFNFNPLGWFTFKKPSEEEISECFTKKDRLKSQGNIYADYIECDRQRPQLISVKEAPLRLRKQTIQDVLFAYLATGTITGLLFLLTKETKK